MDTTNRTAIDVAPGHPRPGLALALALLSIPGSTIAWDLPWGGFWIGLPLGLAAIVLAIHALRRLGRSRMAVAAIAISVLTIGQMAIWTIVGLFS
ncbi:MAG TPA: hypothetical protein VFU34_03330 [Gaiellaceae bacterium]|nr:hypothetical protein [Gaiellaceae bacterium]